MTNFREFPIEILGSSWGMTQKAKPEDNREFRIPRDCFASPLNDENSRIPSKKYPVPRASGCEAKKKPRNSRIL